MPTLRFIQLADLHLGAPFAWLPAEARAERQRDQRRALEAAVAAAIDRRATAILVAGDLFESPGVDADTLAFAATAFARPGCPPVFLAPGAHDPAATPSPVWDPRLVAARGAAWPPHVCVFDAPAWERADLTAAPVTIWGRGVASATRAARPLESRALPPAAQFEAARVHVAVFDGTLDGRGPAHAAPVAPFSAGEVIASPFAYLAAGCGHDALALDGPLGPRLATAGSAVAITPDEAGSHGALEVRIDRDSRRVEIEPLALDDRRVLDVAVDATGAASPDAIDYRVAEALRAAGATPRDLARVRLTGRLARGVRYAAPGAEAAGQAWIVRVDPRGLRPDHDLAGLRARVPTTTEDRFAHALLAELDAETDATKRARLAAALYHGLDAFRLREVRPGYEALAAPAAEVTP